MSSRPENFLVLGDAAAAFPIYGQGMAAAVIGARLLRDRLREADGDDSLLGCANAFQKQLDELIIQPCRSFSTGADYGNTRCRGGRRADGSRRQSRCRVR
jgi:hypothetical protein